MSFTSFTFLFMVLPLFILSSLFLSVKKSNWILLFVSLFFYSWGDPHHFFLLILLMIYNFALLSFMNKRTGKRRKSLLIQGVLVNVFLLFYFKYYGFILNTIGSMFHFKIQFEPIPLPIGISFITFSVLSVLFDYYKDENRPMNGFFEYALYVSFFPKLLMGPIERFEPFFHQIYHRKVSFPKASEGIERFVIGLSKKVLLADSLSVLYGLAIAEGTISFYTVWIAVAAFTLQIYFDFSGYTDMALGLAKIAGFELMENFNYPYIAKSISDFWRRWHISLSQWFRDYIYIPLGGNRVPVPRHILNILVVWMTTGLWHGASWTYIFWGFYYGLLLIIEKYGISKLRLPHWLKWLSTFFLVMIGWVFFFSPTIQQAIHYLGAMFGAEGFALHHTLWLIQNYGIILLLGAIFIFPLPGKIYQRIHHDPQGHWICTAILVLLLFLCIAALLNSTYQSFLYAAF
ncbi:MAG: MBOAT family O-acyltransferase [Beduini sp.]|uniref:MBOAT family O-acyltransferase n=1 Tax=Beduini sp. TaxID=1922300 RepID=UPI0039A3A7F9